MRNHQSSEQYKVFFDNAADLFAVIDPQGTFLDVNKAFERESEYSKEELVGKSIFECGLLTEKSALKIRSNLERVLAGGTSKVYEIQGKSRTGRLIPFELNARPVKHDGKIVAIHAILRDISYRKEIETQLQTEKKKYSELVENIPCVVYSVEPWLDGRTIFISEKCRELSGYSPQDFYNNPYTWLQSLVPEDEESATSAYLDACKKGDDYLLEYRIIHKITGEIRHLRDQGIMVKDATGKVIRVEGFIVDVTTQKKTEDALRESEQRFRTIFENAADGILLAEYDNMRLSAANEKMREMVGYDKEQIKTMNIKDIHPPEEFDHIMDLFEKHRTLGISEAKNIPVQRRDGSIFYADINAIVITLAGRKYFMGIFRDVTKRRETELALAEAEAILRSLLNATTQSIVLVDTKGNIVTMNSVAAKRMGGTIEQLTGKNVRDIWSGDVLQTRLEMARTVLRTGKLMRFEDSRGGRYFNISMSPVFDGQGNMSHFAVFAEDITERKVAEKALLESEQKYRTLVESAKESIFIMDSAGTYLFMNTTGAQRLGGRPEDFVGKTMWQAFPKDVADAQMRHVNKVLEKKKGITVESITMLQGKPRWHSTTIEPLADTDGKIKRVLVVARDIHKSKTFEEELSLYRDKMVRAEHLACVGILSATLAHQLSQPLTVIRLAIENALVVSQNHMSNCPKSLNEDLKAGLAEVDTVSSIIADFRNFARKAPERVIKQVDINTVAHKICRLLKRNAAQVKMKLETRGLESIGPVYWHENDLEQLFFALTENAIRAATGTKEHRLIISGRTEGDIVNLRFSDNCVGIAPDKIDNIFEPFFTTRPVGQGTGLGLYVVSNILSQAGGEISVKSKLNKGTTFFLRLPIRFGPKTGYNVHD